MSIGNIGAGGGPSQVPNGEDKNKNSSSKAAKKAAGFWSKFASSSNTTTSPEGTSKTRRAITSNSSSRSEKLSNLEGKSTELAGSAASFAEVSRKLAEKYEKQDQLKGFSFFNKNLFSKSGSYDVTSKEDVPSGLETKASSLKNNSPESKLATKYKKQAKINLHAKLSFLNKESTVSSQEKGLQGKTSLLKDSSASFLENAEKLAQKKEASKNLKTSLDHFLSNIKKSFTSSSSLKPNSSETMEVLEEVQEVIQEEAETVESIDTCLGDCCNCFTPLKKLFDRISKKTRTTENTENSEKTSCCEDLRLALRKLKNNIEQSITNLREAILSRIHSQTIDFRQKIHEKALSELLNSSSSEHRAKILLGSIFVLADVTGLSCHIENNHLVFSPQSGRLIFAERVSTFSRLVESALQDIDIVPLDPSDIEEVQKKLKNLMSELTSHSNYLRYLLGLFK